MRVYDDNDRHYEVIGWVRSRGSVLPVIVPDAVGAGEPVEIRADHVGRLYPEDE